MAAQLGWVRVLIPHSTPDLPQPVDADLVDSELGELSPCLLNALAVLHATARLTGQHADYRSPAATRWISATASSPVSAASRSRSKYVT